MRFETSVNDIEQVVSTVPAGRVHTRDYLEKIGVKELTPATSPFDPGYDPVTHASHLEQSSQLMSVLKISMACGLIANEEPPRRKIDPAKRHESPPVTGEGRFEIAFRRGQLQHI